VATELCSPSAFVFAHPLLRQVFTLRRPRLIPPLMEAALGISRGTVNPLWYTLRQRPNH
jgi:hypothetical protein